MPNHNAHSACELAEAKLRLRDDLRFSLHEYGGQPCYLAEDRTNSRFYQIGIPEYTFISLLDGSTSFREALHLTAARLGADAFGEAEAEGIIKWLIDTQLATTSRPIEPDRLLQSVSSKKRQRQLLPMNLLLLKVPLLNPESLLDLLEPWLGWALSRSALVAWLVLCLAACRQLLNNANQLGTAANLAFDRNNWGWLLLAWGVLKLFHELGHALTCRRFGGRVREFGVMLILLAPIPYVDVTSSWRFASKWQRIATAAAGMLVELLFAATATLVWSTTDDPLVRHHAFNVMLLGSATTIAFNANFLMRFDGYYIVADLLEIPNLYSLGQEYLRHLGRRCILGIKQPPPRWSTGRSAMIKSYAVASLVWRVIVCACLVILAERLLFGFGLVLSVVAILAWVGWPLLKLARFVAKGDLGQRPDPRYIAGMIAAGGCLIWASFVVVPWPLRVSAPGIVRYADESVVRTGASGIVRDIRVASGEIVEAEQVLAVLENEELAVERSDLELSLSQSRIRSRAYHRNGQMAAYQAEASAQVALEKRLEDVQESLANLLVRAPRAGKVIGRNLREFVGRRLAQGTKLLEIVAEDEKELIVSIDQDEVENFRAQLGQQLTVSFFPGQALRCTLERVDPRASDEIRHPALTALAGGPLAIRPAEKTGAETSSWRYLRPRFTGTVRFTSDHSLQLRAGQKALARLSTARRTFGRQCVGHLAEWVRRRRADG